MISGARLAEALTSILAVRKADSIYGHSYSSKILTGGRLQKGPAGRYKRGKNIATLAQLGMHRSTNFTTRVPSPILDGATRAGVGATNGLVS